MFTLTSTNQFLTWEGEAPAEPWRRRLGRSLALPLLFKRFGIAKMFAGFGGASETVRSKAEALERGLFDVRRWLFDVRRWLFGVRR